MPVIIVLSVVANLSFDANLDVVDAAVVRYMMPALDRLCRMALRGDAAGALAGHRVHTEDGTCALHYDVVALADPQTPPLVFASRYMYLALSLSASRISVRAAFATALRYC